MRILAIDTSCDDTSVALLENDKLISNIVSSQTEFQQIWGGVVPMLAKKLHILRIEAVLLKAISKVSPEAKKMLAELDKPIVFLNKQTGTSYVEEMPNINLEMNSIVKLKNPGIDYIAVTYGPGLSVALEVGLKAAKILAELWNIKIISVNHIEGHIWSGLIKNSKGNLYSNISKIEKGGLSLAAIFSGGHSEILEIEKFGKYSKLIETLDDSAGEAFDKFAVMIGLTYPGGPLVESLAESVKTKLEKQLALSKFKLPIPMKGNAKFAFSFSGLKTAALYLLKEVKDFSKEDSEQFSYAFQHSLIESILYQLEKILKNKQYSYLFCGGGVFANKTLRKEVYLLCKKYSVLAVLPNMAFLQDNAAMIGFVGYRYALLNKNIFNNFEEIERNPNLSLG